MKKLFLILIASILCSCAGPQGRLERTAGPPAIPPPRNCTDAEIAAGTSTTPCTPTPKIIADNYGGAAVEVEDDVYGAGWNGDTNHSPSQNAAYDIISTLQVKPAEGAFADGDKNKLDGIETAADATDATNVAAAGAVMDADIGVSVQAYDADLLTFAGITPSANVQSYLGAANYAAMRSLLSLGTVYQYNVGTGANNIPQLSGTPGTPDGTKYLRDDGTWVTPPGAGGSAIVFDIGDDSGNDSTDVNEIATNGDTNSIFTEPSADKILIDLTQNWPTSDLADEAATGDSATSFFSTGTIEIDRLPALAEGYFWMGNVSGRPEATNILNTSGIQEDVPILDGDAAGQWVWSGNATGSRTNTLGDYDGQIPAASAVSTNGLIVSGGIATIVDSAFWDSGGMTADGTQCADAAKATINSGPAQYTAICADNDASTLYGHVVMPDSWDGGTVTFELEYLQTAADTSALNSDVTAQCRGAGETVNNTWGTEVAIDDAAVTGSNGVDHTTSGAVTPNGTCAGGDTLYWRWQLDATGTTTAAATLHVLGMKMEYTSNVGD